MVATKYNQETIRKDLKDAVVEVFFEKVNGQDRVMRCTLREDMLPPSHRDMAIRGEEDYHKNNPEIVAAWDVDKQGWRSFRIDSIKYMQDVNQQY